MNCQMGSPSARSSTDFSEIHRILCNHIKRGNNFSVAAVVSIEPLSSSSEFWRTCWYRSGIASAMLFRFLDESEDADGTPFSEPITVGDIYTLMKWADPEKVEVRRVIDKLESGEYDPERGTGETATSRERLRSLISEGYAALRNCSFPCANENARIPTPPTRGISSRAGGGGKRKRDSPETQPMNLVRSVGSTTATEVVNDASTDNNSMVGGDVTYGALSVLGQLSALPGSTRTVSSFDAVGDLLNDAVGAPSKSHDTMNEFGTVFEGDSTTAARSSASASAGDRRQRRYKFNAAEDEAIIKGLARFTSGQQRFQQIYYAYRSVWHPARTPNQLYDHWRGTLRYKVIQQEGYRGKNSVAARVPGRDSDLESSE